MAITAKEVNKLRQLTGVGLMACKQALIEAQGDFDKAIEWLRKRGEKLAVTRTGRATKAGLVLAEVNQAHSYGAMIALSCETDFVANNEAFHVLGKTVLTASLVHQPATLETLLQLQVEGLTIQECITALIGKMGENIVLRSYATLQSEVVVPYVHLGSQLGVLVGLRGGIGEKIMAAGRDVAMQIAAMHPIAVDPDRVDTTLVEQELAIAREQAVHEGKPPATIEKIAQGKLHKFFKDHTLLRQPFVKDNAITVAQYLAQVDPRLSVDSFKRLVIQG